MRKLGELFTRPRLRGLRREEVRPATWKLGVASVLAVWGWLALGLALVALQELAALPTLWIGASALLWMLASSLVGALAGCAQLAVLREGTSRRSRGWRARGGMLVASLFGLCLAILGLAGWLLWRRFA